MTARVCPIHGEWSATGICRWCEPAPAKYSRAACDDVSIFRGVGYDWTRGPEVDTPEKLARIANDPPAPGASLQARLDAAWLRHQGYLLAYYHAEWARQEESRLLAQHAALRWERVARRWNYKHRRPGGLDERERAYVWRSWLEQQQRIFDDGDWLRRQIDVGIPKRWP